MGTYFNINGSAMICIQLTETIKSSKTQREANQKINDECQKIVRQFKEKLNELATKQALEDISFNGFYPLGLDIHCFQNNAHGPSTDLDNFENGKRIHIHDTVTLTINGTIETDEHEEHQQLFIKAFQETFHKTLLYRVNLITRSGFRQDAIIFDPHFMHKIITVPLTK